MTLEEKREKFFKLLDAMEKKKIHFQKYSGPVRR